MSLPKCRLFLVAPRETPAQEVAARLEAALSGGDVACLLLPADARSATRDVVSLAQDRDVAVVIGNDLDLALETGADGVQIGASLDAYHAARAGLGRDRIVGAACGTSRHAAMELAEAGADYVAFDQAAAHRDEEPLVAWWADLVEVPCVAFHPVGPEEAADLARQGADFIRPDDGMWACDREARATVAQFNRVIGEALS